MTAGLESVLSGTPINGQSFAARAAGLPRSARALYRSVLEGFIEGAPSPLDSTPADAVGPLMEADLIQADGDGRLTVAYPFSAQPTRHRVTLNAGRSYYAMCAIDALGIPYMLDERGEVQSHEPEAGRIVRVTVDPDGDSTWAPAQAVAVAAFGDGCSLAQSVCPHINLFASPDAGTQYLDSHALHGSVLSITEAATAGRWLFGDLLHSLAGIEAR